jgi:NitT/TauT family transport system ATP-binding protein
MIKIENVSKDFGSKTELLKVLDSISFDIAPGEFVTLFGPNGSGKTTLLNIISGLDIPTSGKTSINNKSPDQAKIGFVFQNYNESMLPWRTVLENVALPLEVKGVSVDERKKKAEHLLDKVGLIAHKDKYFYQLSGGQKQLTAICRAIIYDPELLLMDEPFSALDYSTTKKMELELLDVWQERKITTLFVSHDIDEAIFLADRVIVLSPRPGSIKEVFQVNLPRPRTLDMLSSDEFFSLRNKILASFHYE